ncbi:MAG TPA: class I SAM-dependent methyltransferase [Steroidobacteraceae bacterium]|nr:class I SAM-dependent methyltransferase [Steroidobacteraceae bacterium]
MQSVRDHYASHLAPIYAWMCGGVEAALTRGEAELDALGLVPHATHGAVDLGAGFGMHAIPLARRGFEVLAIDNSRELLRELRTLAAGLQVRIIDDDILKFPAHLTGAPEVILCMGDTLPHLSDEQTVESLFAQAAAAIIPGGHFVLSFRDYTIPLEAERRFIAVKSDSDRILTCFLEYEEGHVNVHDLVHERAGSAWRQRVSAYRKLRLSPDWVAAALERAGFQVSRQAGSSGMVRLVAKAKLHD